ncbi:MAG TPA: DUF2442 domain-containing protein [Flavobacteriales bacterium]|nr:DUF2442 domain-containing protein [Flavobacteriales bacterium]
MSTKTSSSRRGGGTSANRPAGPDPIEAMILKEGLRIADVHPYKELDLLAIVLNSGDLLQARLSDFERLRKASSAQLRDWRLIGGGIGIHWEALDEDLSLRGFIRDGVQQEALRRLAGRRVRKTKGKGVVR